MGSLCNTRAFLAVHKSMSIALNLCNQTIDGLIKLLSDDTGTCFTAGMLLVHVLSDTSLVKVSGSDLIVPTVIDITSLVVGGSSVILIGLTGGRYVALHVVPSCQFVLITV